MNYEDAQGALAGDSTARRVQSVIRSTTTGIKIYQAMHTALSDIGITSDRYGQLTLDSSKFQSALSTNPDDLKTLFSGNTITQNLDDNTDSTGLADSLKAAIDVYINSSTGMLISGSVR